MRNETNKHHTVGFASVVNRYLLVLAIHSQVETAGINSLGIIVIFGLLAVSSDFTARSYRRHRFAIESGMSDGLIDRAPNKGSYQF